MMRRYTETEKQFFREFVPGHSYKEIQAEFTNRFGEISLMQVKGYIGNHKLNTGRTGHFEKGHTPWGKGKKMSREQYKASEPTMFKKGNMPHNTDPIGTEKVLTDGYTWVKVDDKPHARKQENWKQKHRLIYERAHGLIEKGKLVIFLDGDKTNFNIENLAAITRGEHALMNRYGLRCRNGEITKAGVTTAKLMEKITEVKK